MKTLDDLDIIACVKWGDWRWHGGVLKLHNACIQHDPRCDGNCEATQDIEHARKAGLLIDKPRHKLRAAI